MTIDNRIRDQKLQCVINKETAKISASSFINIYKHKYLTGEEILPSNQRQIIEQAKLTDSLLSRIIEKQIKMIDKGGET